MRVDLTGIALSVISVLMPLATAWLVAVINARIKDVAARATLAAAVRNSLGAIQQGMTTGATTLHPAINIAGLSPGVALGVQYVVDHAGAEAARFGLTPELLADKVNAQIGLAKLAAPTLLPITLPAAEPAPVTQPLKGTAV